MAISKEYDFQSSLSRDLWVDVSESDDGIPQVDIIDLKRGGNRDVSLTCAIDTGCWGDDSRISKRMQERLETLAESLSELGLY